MRLSKKDQEFYEDKLNWRRFGLVFLSTAMLGAIVWPLSVYMIDQSNGQAGNWSFSVVFNVSFIGFMLGTIMSVLMFLVFKFLLAMGWLPSRR